MLGHLRYAMPAPLAMDSEAFSVAPQAAPSAPATTTAPEQSTSPSSSEEGFSLSSITNMVSERLGGVTQGPVIYAVPAVVVLGLGFFFIRRRRSKKQAAKGDAKQAARDEEMALARTGRSAKTPV